MKQKISVNVKFGEPKDLAFALNQIIAMFFKLSVHKHSR